MRRVIHLAIVLAIAALSSTSSVLWGRQAGTPVMAALSSGISFPTRTTWHPGEHLAVRWIFAHGATRGGDLGLTLRGPFTSASAIKVEIETGGAMGPIVAARYVHLGIIAAQRSYTVVLVLPVATRPGYYNLEGVTRIGKGFTSTVGGAAIIRIYRR